MKVLAGNQFRPSDPTLRVFGRSEEPVETLFLIRTDPLIVDFFSDSAFSSETERFK